MAEAKSSIEDGLKRDVDAIKADMDALRKDLVAVLDTLKGTASTRAEAEIEALRKRLDRIATGAQASGRESLRKVEEQIEERPLVSLAIAFAVGLLLGRIFNRR